MLILSLGSLTVACIAAFALINARVVRYLGARWSGMLGIGFMGLGEVLASFSTHSVAALFVTEGIIMGIGARYLKSTHCERWDY